MMTAVLAVACLFAALVAEGNTLSCYHCVGTSAELCSSNSRTCTSSKHTCLTAYTEITAAGTIVKTVVRGCDDSKSCNQVYSFNSLSTTRFKTTCCNTENCTPKESPAIPPASTQENGVICPVCSTESSSTCSSEQMLKCRGNETKCLSLSGDISAGGTHISIATRGCATENLCATESAAGVLGAAAINVKVYCTSSCIRTEHGLLLAITAGFMLLKAIV